MYRDISVRAAARVVVCAASTPCYLSARPSTGPSACLHISTHVVRVMSQLSAARKIGDAVVQPLVPPAENMSPSDRPPGHFRPSQHRSHPVSPPPPPHA